MPNPKPLAQHKRDGTLRDDRHGARMEQSFTPGKPRKSSRVPADAKWLWDLVTTHFPSDAMSPLDAANVEAACRWWSRWNAYDALLDESRGTKDEYKLVMLAVASWKQCEKILSQYGMSPAARMRLKQPPAQTEEEDALTQVDFVRAKLA